MAHTVDHNLLLRAVLLEDPAALEAWRDWRARTSIDALDRDSQWLLPLLFVNLRDRGVAPHDLARYANVYRHNWYKNQLKLRRAADDLVPRWRAGSPVVIAGGAAMALCHHQDAIGARPFGEVALRQFTPETAAQAAGTSVRWRAIEWRVQHPADALVDICVSREDWDPLSRLFWLTDTVTMVRRTPAFDWPRVAVVGDRRGQSSAVMSALREIDERCATRLADAARVAFTPLTASAAS